MCFSKIHLLAWYVTCCTQSNCSGRNINFIPCASAATTFAKRTQQHYKIFVFVLDQIITLGKGAKNWYCLVLSPKPVIALVTAEAMFEAKPPLFAKCTSCICRKVQKVVTKVVQNNKLSVQYLQRIYIQNDLQKKSCWEWQFAKIEQKWSTRQFVTLEKMIHQDNLQKVVRKDKIDWSKR